MFTQAMPTIKEQCHTHTLDGVCPSCKLHTTFRDGGVQKWPSKVAAAAGLPPVIQLWTCNHCHSTFGETTLVG